MVVHPDRSPNATTTSHWTELPKGGHFAAEQPEQFYEIQTFAKSEHKERKRMNIGIIRSEMLAYLG